MDDRTLLGDYVENRSEAAFSQLVERHFGMVHSSARRRAGSASAEDVTQAVFIVLARKAHRLRHLSSLAGWLFKTTQYAAIDALRRESRRQTRERVSEEGRGPAVTNPHEGIESWMEISPYLDEALDSLNTRDREAVLLRYFENRSYAEVATAVGASENTVTKRIARAVDRLRDRLQRRGVAVPSSVLAGVLSSRAIEAAPAELAGNIAAAALQGAQGTVVTGAVSIADAAMKLAVLAKVKVALAYTAVVLVCAGGVGAVANLMDGSNRGAAAQVGSRQAPGTASARGASERMEGAASVRRPGAFAGTLRAAGLSEEKAHALHAAVKSAAASLRRPADPQTPGAAVDSRFGGQGALTQRLMKIEIPELDFRQTNIAGAITFLEEMAAKHESSQANQGRPVKFQLELAGKDAQTGGPTDVPPITFSARYISVFESLRIVTQLCGMKYYVLDENTVVVTPYDPKITQEAFRIPPERMRDVCAGGTLAQVEWKQVLGGMGVEWPAEAKADYEPPGRWFPGHLTVFTSRDGHAKLAEVLGRGYDSLTSEEGLSGLQVDDHPGENEFSRYYLLPPMELDLSPEELSDLHLKRILQGYHVSWPEGATVRYDAKGNTLHVDNNERNLTELRRLFSPPERP